MPNATRLNVNGQTLLLADGEARAKADAALEVATLLRAQSIDTFGGRNLATQFSGEILNFENEWEWLQDRTQRGDFSGLMIGDYLDVTLTTGSQMRYRIGAIDPYYGACDSPMGHHIAMIPDEAVSVSGSYAVNGDHLVWNTSGKNQGTASEKHPYLVSTLHKWETDVFYPMLPLIVRERIKTHRVLLEERYSTAGDQTKATGWSWADLGKIWSPSEVEVYGSTVWGTPGYSYGFECHFPIFAMTKDRIKYTGQERADWWLRAPSGSSATAACSAHATGTATTGSVTNTGLRPLPCFLIG